MNKHIIALLILSLAGLSASYNVMEVAREKGYTEFFQAVEKSGLLEHATKQEDEDGSMAPFTVFVPTNEAMEQLGEADEDEIKSLIKFHVVPGQKYTAPDEFPTDGIPTVGQQLIMVTGEDNSTLFLEDSETQVTIVDGIHNDESFSANNGVCYIINGVLKPFEEVEADSTTEETSHENGEEVTENTDDENEHSYDDTEDDSDEEFEE